MVDAPAAPEDKTVQQLIALHTIAKKKLDDSNPFIPFFNDFVEHTNPVALRTLIAACGSENADLAAALQNKAADYTKAKDELLQLAQLNSIQYTPRINSTEQAFRQHAQEQGGQAAAGGASVPPMPGGGSNDVNSLLSVAVTRLGEFIDDEKNIKFFVTYEENRQELIKLDAKAFAKIAQNGQVTAETIMLFDRQSIDPHYNARITRRVISPLSDMTDAEREQIGKALADVDAALVKQQEIDAKAPLSFFIDLADSDTYVRGTDEHHVNEMMYNYTHQSKKRPIPRFLPREAFEDKVKELASGQLTDRQWNDFLDDVIKHGQDEQYFKDTYGKQEEKPAGEQKPTQEPVKDANAEGAAQLMSEPLKPVDKSVYAFEYAKAKLIAQLDRDGDNVVSSREMHAFQEKMKNPFTNEVVATTQQQALFQALLKESNFNTEQSYSVHDIADKLNHLSGPGGTKPAGVVGKQ